MDTILSKSSNHITKLSFMVGYRCHLYISWVGDWSRGRSPKYKIFCQKESLAGQSELHSHQNIEVIEDRHRTTYVFSSIDRCEWKQSERSAEPPMEKKIISCEAVIRLWSSVMLQDRKTMQGPPFDRLDVRESSTPSCLSASVSLYARANFCVCDIVKTSLPKCKLKQPYLHDNKDL